MWVSHWLLFLPTLLMQLHWLRILLRDLADVTLVSGDTDDRDDPDGQDDNDDNEDNDDNKGIGDAGSTEDIRMLWSAMLCYSLPWSGIVCLGCCWSCCNWLGCWLCPPAIQDAGCRMQDARWCKRLLTSSFAPFRRSGRYVGLHPLASPWLFVCLFGFLFVCFFLCFFNFFIQLLIFNTCLFVC